MPPIPLEIIQNIIDQVFISAIQRTAFYKSLQQLMYECERREESPFYHRRFKGGLLASWDNTTLKACSLVCKSWLQRSRFHLFAKFTAVNQTHIDRCLRGVSVTASYLRHLGLEDCNSAPWLIQSLPRLLILRQIISLELFNADFTVLEESPLAQILGQFQELQHLVILQCRFQSPAQAIQALCACPNLLSLEFCRQHLLPMSSRQPLQMPSMQDALPRLRSLIFQPSYANSEMLQWLRDSPGVPPLRILKTHVALDEDIPTISQTIRLLSFSLEHLQIGLSYYSGLTTTFYRTVDLAFNDQLRTLYFHGVLLSFMGDLEPSKDVSPVPLIIGQISSTKIQEIILVAQMRGLSDLEYLNLSELEDVLERPNFRGLRRLRLRLSPEDMVVGRPFLQEKLAGCHSRGILSIEATGS